MGQFASSAFTGTAGDSVPTADSNWTRHASSSAGCNLVITDANAARTDGSAGAALYYHSGTPASADYSANVDLIRFTGANTGLGVTFRHSTSAETFYMARYLTSAASWQMYKAVTGTYTQLGSNVAVTFTDGQTKNLKIEAIGTAIKAYAELSGTAAISVTDSSITAAGKAGLRHGFGGAVVGTNSTSYHYDNFSADDAGSGTTAITATPADATASGVAASFNVETAISGTAANATAAGVAADVNLNVSVSATPADAAAAGVAANLNVATGINATPANATAEGVAASVVNESGTVIAAVPADATASGATASLNVATAISATAANATASGVDASVSLGAVVVDGTDTNDGWLQPVKRKKPTKEVRNELERLFNKAEIVVEKIAEPAKDKQEAKQPAETNTVDIGLPPLTELQMLLMRLRTIQDEMTGQQVQRLAEIQQEMDRARMFNILARAALLAA